MGDLGNGWMSGVFLVEGIRCGEYSMPWWVSETWLKEHGCARRDFGDDATVGLTLDRWSAEPLYLSSGVYAGTAVRAPTAQRFHPLHPLRQAVVRHAIVHQSDLA